MTQISAFSQELQVIKLFNLAYYFSLSSQSSGLLSSGSSISAGGTKGGVMSSVRLPFRKGIWSTMTWYSPVEWITERMDGETC